MPHSSNPPKPIYVRWWFWLPLVLVALVLIAAAIASPIASHYTRKALGELEGHRGDFSRVTFNLFTLTYTIHDLSIVEDPIVDQKEPVLTAKMVRARVLVGQLLRFNLVGAAHIGGAKLTWVHTPHSKKEVIRAAEKLEEAMPPIAQVDDVLRSLIPFKLGRVEAQKAEILLIDGEVGTYPRIWIHDIELSLENFATRRRLDQGAPAIFAMSGKLQHSGTVSIFVTADPLAKILKFAGQAEVSNLQLADLHGIIAGRTGLHIPEGRFDVRASFKSENGRITGGVRPLLKKVRIEAADQKDLGDRIKAQLADTTLDLFSDDNSGRDLVGTTIPIKGRLERPTTQLVPTLIGVLRNAFVEGLSTGFRDLPPPTAKEKEGVIEQTVEGLSEEKQPKAQPENEK